MRGFVYILESLKDHRQYIGSTPNIQRRLEEHNRGFVKSTRNRRPLVLKYILEYSSIEMAAKMEKKFKRSHDSLRRELEIRGVAPRQTWQGRLTPRS
ncbi:GIY-YIG nuclease family protein [Candidatus Shapirobacteria bacterium]|nr:GIY-YIG nuclease family protein [Candidatus Shapirobacteria bacterium]